MGEKSDIDYLLDTPNLAAALASDRFKQFLDHMPVAIAVAELKDGERIVYANLAFERLTGSPNASIEGQTWHALPGSGPGIDKGLGAAILDGQDHVGSFMIARANGEVSVDAWSNIIEDDDGRARFRLVALAEKATREDGDLGRQLSEKEMLLRELQHRVKNNLQMITALIRLETRTTIEDPKVRFGRLAGRIESMALLYQSLSNEDAGDVVDLGIYVSQIATAVMRAQATEGIHLDMRVDTWLASINVAMPTGLVVNELLTNALKHAFAGRDGGTITLHCLVARESCRVVVADDGIGLAAGTSWPSKGKLSALIVQSLRENAKATVDVVSAPGEGMRVTIDFTRADAEAATDMSRR